MPSFLHLDGQPFGMVVGQDGQRVVVSLSAADGSGQLAIVELGAAGPPQLVRTVLLPKAGAAFGMAASHDGRLLAVTNDTGVLLLDLPALLAGSPSAYRAQLQDGTSGTIEAAFSADDRALFVADENSAMLSVYDMPAGRPAGRIHLAPGPVGVVLSPDGRFLYVTTEGNNDLTSPQTMLSHGFIWTLDAAAASHGSSRSIVSSVDAGCTPVRVATSPDGSTVWVTARGAHALLAFDAAALRGTPKTALRAVAQVGPQPVGIALVDNGRLALVADSARSAAPGGRQTLAVIDTSAALRGRHALLGYLPAGEFPREIAVDAQRGQALITNFNSHELETLPVAGLPVA